jgi:predicted RNase H-like HicB family nuclease
MTMDLTAIIKKGEKQFVALCPELDVVSQGLTVEEALKNIKEAVELYIEEMGLPEGIGTQEMLVTSFEVCKHAKTASPVGA